MYRSNIDTDIRDSSDGTEAIICYLQTSREWFLGGWTWAFLGYSRCLVYFISHCGRTKNATVKNVVEEYYKNQSGLSIFSLLKSMHMRGCLIINVFLDFLLQVEN